MHLNRQIIVALIFLNLFLFLAIFQMSLPQFTSNVPLKVNWSTLIAKKAKIESIEIQYEVEEEITTTRRIVRRTTTTTSQPTTTEDAAKIPKTIYFAFGFDNCSDFGLSHYLAIKSAKLIAKPHNLKLFYQAKPKNSYWFDRALKLFVDSSEMLAPLPGQIYDHQTETLRPRLDFFKLKTLLKTGGIFLDLDVITVKPFDEIMEHDAILALDFTNGGMQGVSTSFLMARAGNKFLNSWIEDYRHFSQQMADHYCCQLPRMMAFQYPKDVFLLDGKAVLWPGNDHQGLKDAYFDRSFNYDINNYATRLWTDQTAATFLKNLTLHKIWHVDTSAFCHLRKLTLDEEEVVAEKWQDMPEWKQNCERIQRQMPMGAARGLVANWPLKNVNATLPKIVDSGQFRMHGFVSPLNGYETIHGDEFASLSQHFVAFRGGDHVYLPVWPELVNPKDFTLSIWMRLHETNAEIRFRKNRRAVVMSFEYGDPANKVINIETISGKSILLSYEGSESALIEIQHSKWLHLAISGSKGNFNLEVSAICDTKSGSLVSNFTKLRTETQQTSSEVFFQAFSGIWLGRRAVGKLNDEGNTEELNPKRFKGSAHFDAALIRLYDNAGHARNLESEIDCKKLLAASEKI